MSERRARGEGSLRLHGGVWQARFFDRHRKRKEISTKTDNLTKAKKTLRKWLAEVSEGTERDDRNLRYDDLRKSYLADYVANERKSLRHDAEGRPHLDAVARLDDFFGGVRVATVSADLIRKFQIEQRQKGLSNASINRSVSALRRMFYLAFEDEKLRHIPHFPMLKESAPRE